MKKIILLFTLSSFLFSCDVQDCDEDQTNPVLRDNGPETEKYQRELASLLLQADEADTEYYFEEIMDRNGNQTMVLNVIGSEVCGELRLLVKDENRFEPQTMSKPGFKHVKVEGLRFELPEEGFPVLTDLDELDDLFIGTEIPERKG